MAVTPLRAPWIALAVALLGGGSGCSALVMHDVDVAYPQPPNCNDSTWPVAYDAVAATSSLLMTASMMDFAEAWGGGDEGASEMLAIGLLSASVYAVSGVYGFSQAVSCREKKAAWNADFERRIDWGPTGPPVTTR